jgi:DNA polymerase-1
MKKFGFSEEKAKFIEESHKNLYKVYYDYINRQIEKARIKGYVTLAFGLRLRTPRLVAREVPKFALKSEQRSAGNALFQSYSLLTTRAFSRFMRRVWKHPLYCDKVFAIVTIYDSIYVDIPNDLDCLKWVNDNLIECMKDISDCPELQHDTVKLGSELELYYPSWANPITIPNNASMQQIEKITKEL